MANIAQHQIGSVTVEITEYLKNKYFGTKCENSAVSLNVIDCSTLPAQYCFHRRVGRGTGQYRPVNITQEIISICNKCLSEKCWTEYFKNRIGDKFASNLNNIQIHF